MDISRIMGVTQIYRELFTELEIDQVEYSEDLLLEQPDLTLEHCYGMLDKIDEFVRVGRTDKAFRWLGFVQAILWMNQCYTLAELKAHNRTPQ